MAITEEIGMSVPIPWPTGDKRELHRFIQEDLSSLIGCSAADLQSMQVQQCQRRWQRPKQKSLQRPEPVSRDWSVWWSLAQLVPRYTAQYATWVQDQVAVQDGMAAGTRGEDGLPSLSPIRGDRGRPGVSDFLLEHQDLPKAAGGDPAPLRSHVRRRQAHEDGDGHVDTPTDSLLWEVSISRITTLLWRHLLEFLVSYI